MTKALTQIQTKSDLFRHLYAIDVSPFIQIMDYAGRAMEYIEWATCWRLIQENYPGSKFTIHEKDGLPYVGSPYGVFVHVSLEIDGKTESDWYAVDAQTITTFEITNAHQRALVKCAGRHGLGLKLWEKGEREKLTAERKKTGHSTSVPPAVTPPSQSAGVISEPQMKRLFAIAKGSNYSDEAIKRIIRDHKYEHTRDIKKTDYEKICSIFSVPQKPAEIPPPTDDDIPF